MEPSIWKVICILFLMTDLTGSIALMSKRGEWNAKTIGMAIGGLGGELIVLLYVLGVIR